MLINCLFSLDGGVKQFVFIGSGQNVRLRKDSEVNLCWRLLLYLGSLVLFFVVVPVFGSPRLYLWALGLSLKDTLISFFPHGY